MSDIFLSYARLDNDKDESDNRDGWVAYFHKRLILILSQKIGKRIDFWRDVQEIKKGEVWHGPIKEALTQANVLLPVLSPAFFESENCRFELNYFLDKHAEQASVAEVVIKILKHQIDPTFLPAAIREPEAYQFFLVDKTRGELAFYDPAVGLREDRKLEFRDELERLANQLAGRIVKPKDEALPCGPCVYLAVPITGSSLAEAYLRVDGELRRRGALLVPDRKRFYADLDNPDSIRLEQAVTNSRLAVHLLDPTAGKEAMALDRRQLEATTERAKFPDRLQRMIWIAPRSSSGHDNELLQHMRRLEAHGGGLVKGDSLVEESLESFVKLLLRKLFPNEESVTPPAALESRPTLYLIALPEDVAAARGRGIARLKDRFRCRLPLGPDAKPTARAAHEAEQLASCNAVGIYWGHGDEAWVYGQLARTERWQERNRAAAFIRRIILIGPEEQSAKATFYYDDDDVELIDLREPLR
jgi:hypothetical protein